MDYRDGCDRNWLCNAISRQLLTFDILANPLSRQLLTFDGLARQLSMQLLTWDCFAKWFLRQLSTLVFKLRQLSSPDNYWSIIGNYWQLLQLVTNYCNYLWLLAIICHFLCNYCHFLALLGAIIGTIFSESDQVFCN